MNLTDQAQRQQIIIILLVGVTAAIMAVIMAKASASMAVIAIIGLLIAVLTVINTEFALYVLIFAMLLGPQIGIGGVEQGGRGRGITLRVDDFLLIIIGFSWFLKTAIQKELGLLLRTPLNIPIAIYFIICVTATILGYMMDRVKSTIGLFYILKYFEYYVVYFIAVNFIREEKQIKRYMGAMLIVCFIVSLYAISYMMHGMRASAPFEGAQGEPNTLGGYLIFMLSLMVGLALYWGNGKQKIALFTAIFVGFVALAATLSRSSWIALVPAAIALIHFSDQRRRKWIFLAIVLFFFSLPFITPRSVQQRILFTINQPRESGQLAVGKVRLDTSTSARLTSMKIVLARDFVKQPLFGYGVTGYAFLDAQYARVLAETGLLGFLAFLYLLRCIYRQARLTLTEAKDPFFRGMTLGYLVGFIALLVHGIGANTFIIVRIMEPFWFVTAMIVMIPRIEAGEFLLPRETKRSNRI